MTSSFTVLPNSLGMIVEFSTEHDRTPAIASHCHSFHYMPNSLIQLLNWVTNDKTFNTGDNTPEMQTDDLRKC